MPAGEAIVPFQIPVATGGNGAITYTTAFNPLPAGLKFDATGTDAGGCTASDFPVGTAASWATAPRTVCGTPTTATAGVLVYFVAHDADSNRSNSDRDTWNVTFNVYAASIASTSPASLTATNLNTAAVNVRLRNATFQSGVTTASFELVTTIPGLSISQVSGVTLLSH